MKATELEKKLLKIKLETFIVSTTNPRDKMFALNAKERQKIG